MNISVKMKKIKFNLINILSNGVSPVKNAFGDFNNLKQWAQDTAYIDYLSFT